MTQTFNAEHGHTQKSTKRPGGAYQEWPLTPHTPREGELRQSGLAVRGGKFELQKVLMMHISLCVSPQIHLSEEDDAEPSHAPGTSLRPHLPYTFNQNHLRNSPTSCISFFD